MATLKGWNLLMAAKDVTSTRVWGLLEEPQPRCHHHPRPPLHPWDWWWHPWGTGPRPRRTLPGRVAGAQGAVADGHPGFALQPFPRGAVICKHNAPSPLPGCPGSPGDPRATLPVPAGSTRLLHCCFLLFSSVFFGAAGSGMGARPSLVASSSSSSGISSSSPSLARLCGQHRVGTHPTAHTGGAPKGPGVGVPTHLLSGGRVGLVFA